jgi:DNA-3-methyladenine glycosylase I
MTIKRCAWVNPDNEPMARYHDEEWGVPVRDDRVLFEFLVLEGAQAGLSWDTILKKRDGYRKAFCGFDPARCARLTDSRLDALMENPDIVRNRLKIRSVRTNAVAFLAIAKEFGSFSAYLWDFVGGKPVDGKWRNGAEIPVRDETSDALARDLKKRGMKFVGTTIMYAYMQAVGMVNAHTVDCPRHAACKRLAR